MENAQDILVIILASALAVLLVLAIVVAVKTIQILNHLRRITETAEKIATTAESVGELFRFTAGPVAIGKLLSNVVDTVMKHRNKSTKQRGNDE